MATLPRRLTTRIRTAKLVGCRRKRRWDIGPGWHQRALTTTRTSISRELYIYYGQGNGFVHGGIGLQQYGVGQVTVADFNGDGIPDIAVFETGCDGDSEGCTVTSAATTEHRIWHGGWRVRRRRYRFQPAEQSGIAVRSAWQSRHQGRLGLQQRATSNSTTFFTLLNTTTGNFPTCAAPKLLSASLSAVLGQEVQ